MKKNKKGTATTTGNFDGVHRGHLEVFRKLKNIAESRGLEPIAITFLRHPLHIIAPERVPDTITTAEEKRRLIEKEGVRPLILDFDEKMRNLTASEWMKILKDDYGVEVLVAGYDNKFGIDGRQMTIEDYKQIGRDIGVEVVEAPELKGASSSAIRRAVKQGDMETAQDMLGRPFRIKGKVVEGHKLGREIGFPTANISTEEKRLLPGKGVYAALITTERESAPAMVNIGMRPTVNDKGEEATTEAHIIDWTGDLYGKNVELIFLKKIREEKKFKDLDELKEQLESDKKTVKNFLSQKNIVK